MDFLFKPMGHETTQTVLFIYMIVLVIAISIMISKYFVSLAEGEELKNRKP